MAYFVINVKTGSEKKFIERLKEPLAATQTQLIFLQRKLSIRKQGVKKEQILPIFSGYLFVCTETPEVNVTAYSLIRKTEGFFRFLKSNTEPTPLTGNDLRLLQHFKGFGNIAESSKVRFDEQDRIVIIEGPLMGLEGNIVKIDKRKGRAKIHLDMYEEHFLLDLAFTVIEKSQDKSE